MPDTTIAIRMYNVGFGDAFTVTVRRGDAVWRMLVDCGVHSQGRARPISEVVEAIIGDLGADTVGTASLDVVVATHHHADHISGFACDDWEQVTVGEVWVPYVEDPKDKDAQAIRSAQTAVAKGLTALIEQRTRNLESDTWSAAISAAHAFAVNSGGNAAATDRLLRRAGKGFKAPHRVRYLPDKTPTRNRIEVKRVGAVVHVLGPPRDPNYLRRMNPPKSAGWLQLDIDDNEPGDGNEPGNGSPKRLFDPRYVLGGTQAPTTDLEHAKTVLRLDNFTNDAGLLGAAALLERAVNNTSLFFVLDVAGTRLLFPGDAQQGAWEHVLADSDNKRLLSDIALYKVGHHGSHNATPRSFIENVWNTPGFAMIPFGLVKRWADTIPKQELLDALHEHRHCVIRADAPVAADGVTVNGDLWSEVTLTVGQCRAGRRPWESSI
ncbi:hypothetical protein ACFV24_27045 [Nocardia fluminea]|uniref:hypothetical protein n=1 Tax=Nocardia fluminea TaxID=134984 RepID=UPI00366D2A0D